MPRSVFISYARTDLVWVNLACRLFQVSGTRTFLDVSNIEFGARWEEELRKALAGCARVVVFWSASAAQSEWVEREWRLALTLNKRVVPVLLDDTPLHPALSVFQASKDMLELMKLARKMFDAKGVLDNQIDRLGTEPVALAIGSVTAHGGIFNLEMERPAGISLLLWTLVKKPVQTLVRSIVVRERRDAAEQVAAALSRDFERRAGRINDLFEQTTLVTQDVAETIIATLAADFTRQTFGEAVAVYD